MAINITIFSHDHNYHKAIWWEPAHYPVINGQLQPKVRGKFVKGFKCKLCRVKGVTDLPNHMKGIDELMVAFEALSNGTTTPSSGGTDAKKEAE